jgi:pimeloyl-ACP methyl ester carboxylesterase
LKGFFAVRTFSAAVLVALLYFFVPASPAAATSVSCRGDYLSVARYPGDPESHRVFGELCRPARLTPDTPVQLLLHGATYNHTYWSAYARLAATRGFATFNLDRLGYGRSDHPDPATLDLPAAGHVTHQVVNTLHHKGFRRVVVNAHSLGGLVAHEAARYGGITAMIISGMPPGAPDTRTAAFPPFYPAEQDPEFAGRGWPAGYLTTMPGTRVETFLYPGTYGPAIPRIEETTLKDTVPEPELMAIGTPPAPTGVPTLSVLGRHDMFYCAETADCQTAPAGQRVDAIIPDAGHSINVSRGASAFYALTFDWLAHLRVDE